MLSISSTHGFYCVKGLFVLTFRFEASILCVFPSLQFELKIVWAGFRFQVGHKFFQTIYCRWGIRIWNFWKKCQVNEAVCLKCAILDLNYRPWDWKGDFSINKGLWNCWLTLVCALSVSTAMRKEIVMPCPYL